MVEICRREHFNAAHKLYNPNWSKAQNESIFGACANKNWHGHNFELIVAVKGKPDPDTGFVLNLKALSQLIRREIIDKVDHRNLNIEVDFMQGKIPSCENMVTVFWEILYPKIREMTKGATLYCIELHETRQNFVRYYGE